MSTLKIDELKNNGSAIDLPNGIKVGGKEIVQGYTSSGTEPASPVTGDFWWDSTNEELYQYVNGEFKAIGIVVIPPWVVDLTQASYDSVSFSVASQATSPSGLRFNEDGTKIYILDAGNDKVFQYTLSTGFDLSTASYDSVEFAIGTQESNPAGFNFNTDGTKMYVVGTGNDTVYQYSLSTGFDLSTASYDSVSFSVASQVNEPSDVLFNTDGTKMYVTGPNESKIFQYSLSTAFDLSTASYNTVNGAIFAQCGGAFFNPDGTKLYAITAQTDTIRSYTLSTGFDVSTISDDSVTFSVSSQEAVPLGVVFNLDGTKMYICGAINDTVYQYSTGL